MRAVAHAGGGHFEVVSLPDPAPGPDDLVIRVHSCGICGSDLKAGSMMPSGTIMGHEFCGEVVDAGQDVRANWRDGDVVASMPLRSCGRCRWCLTGDVAHCENGEYLGLGGAPGAFAEYVKVSSAVTFPLPEGIGERGALVEPLAVGLHAVANAGLQPGMSTLIMGGGSVGAAVLVWAHRFGAGRIVVSDPSSERREAVLAMGATSAYDPSEDDIKEHFDVVIECVGGVGMAQKAVDYARTRGRVLIAGVCAAPDQIMHLSGLMKEVELRYVVFYTANEFALAAQLLGRGDLEVEQFIAGRTGFDEFERTFTGLSRRELHGKYLVQPSLAAS